MTDPDRPSPKPEGANVAEPARPDAALPITGRSAPLGEIGRELGDLDFEPEDLLASLRPFEPDLPINSKGTQTASSQAVSALDKAPEPEEMDVSPGSTALGAPKLPNWNTEEQPSESSWEIGTAQPRLSSPEPASSDQQARPEASENMPVPGRSPSRATHDPAVAMASAPTRPAPHEVPSRAATAPTRPTHEIPAVTASTPTRPAHDLPHSGSDEAHPQTASSPSIQSSPPELGIDEAQQRRASTTDDEVPTAIAIGRGTSDARSAPSHGSNSVSNSVPPASSRLGLGRPLVSKRPVAPPRPPPPRPPSSRHPDPKSRATAAAFLPRSREATTTPGIPSDPAPVASAAFSSSPTVSSAGGLVRSIPPDSVAPDGDAPDVVASEDVSLLEDLVGLPPDRSDALLFENERPAGDHLAERDLIDAFHGMAVILTKEAQVPRHPHEQAELAIVNSELLAMLGEFATAREYLQALSQTSTPATALLTRQLAFTADDLPAYARAIRAELRTNVPPEARRHLMSLYCDVLRLIPNSETELRRQLELSSRAFPSDPRFLLQRLAAQFADRAQSKLRLPTVPDSPQLSEAIRDLAALRTGQVKLGSCAHSAGPLILARRAWQERQFEPLLDAIHDLRSIEDLSVAAAWLHASLTSFYPKCRDLDTEVLDRFAEQGDDEAECALLERRLHATSNQLSNVEAFSTKTVANLSPVERLSLGVALAASGDMLQLLSEGVPVDAPTYPLAAAVGRLHALRPATSTDDQHQDLQSQASLALGRALGDLRTQTDATAGSVEESIATLLDQLDPEDRYVKVLRLWLHLHEGDPTALARSVAELLPEVCSIEPAWLLALGVLLANFADAKELEGQLLESGTFAQPALEVLARARLARDAALEPGEVLSDLTQRLEPGRDRRPWLELEAAASDRSSPEALERFLQQQPPSNPPALGAMVALLLATLSKPSNMGWARLAQQANAPDVELFTTLLETLGNESLTPEQANKPDATVVARLAWDPLARSLLSALGADEGVGALGSAVTDRRLEQWLRMRAVVDKVPLDIASIAQEDLNELAERQSEPLVRALCELVYRTQHGDRTAFEQQLLRAEAAQTPAERVDILADAESLDPECVPGVGSVEVAQRIFAHSPEYLPALRTLTRSAAQDQSFDAIGPFAMHAATQLEPDERLSHAWLALASTKYAEGSPENLEQGARIGAILEQHCIEQQNDGELPVWVVRRLFELARQRRDDNGICRFAGLLRHSISRAFDAATLALRAAEAASRLGNWDAVGELLNDALELCPEHLVALSLRAEYLEQRGDKRLAAAAYDALADAACMPAHKVSAWLRAAKLWSEAGSGDEEQAHIELALEHAVQLEPGHEEASLRLRALYRDRDQLDRLEGLLTQMLVRAESPEQRAELELERARILVELGRVVEAQGGLERVLSLFPDQQDALDLSARLYEEQQDFEEAEQQWLRLANLRTDTARQADAYERLATLYEMHLEQPARAETAYREVLRRKPGAAAADQLVQLLLRNENPNGAIELLQQLLPQTTDPALERSRNLMLAQIYDENLGDRRRAEEILDRARRRWPNDAQTIAALAGFFRRGKDFVALGALLDRSLTDARRALSSGRFDGAFFEVIASVAEQREQHDFVQVANATLAAIQARSAPIEGIGMRAAEESFADVLAPEVLSLPLRAMLRKTGGALCAAQPIHLRALRATPLANSHLNLAERLVSMAEDFGIDRLDLHLSPALGMACQATSSSPPTLVVGSDFVTIDDEGMRDALAIRALRILSANAAALANTAPVDLWPLLSAYLSAYLPDWSPPGVDRNKLTQLRDRIQHALPRTTDADLPVLAADVAGSIGNRASQLGVAVQQWGARTALLALGDPGIVLRAIAAATGQLDRLAEEPLERQKWIVRNPEARDLAIFSVTDAYIETRARAANRR